MRFLAEDFPKYINEFCHNVDKRLGKRGDQISALGKAFEEGPMRRGNKYICNPEARNEH